MAFLVQAAVFHGQRDLGILHTAADETGQPQPEHAARPAVGDSHSGTDNVARPQGGGQRAGHRLEAGELALLRLLPKGFSDGVFQDKTKLGELQEAQPNGQLKAAANNENQHWNSPQPIGKCLNRAQDHLHDSSSLFFLVALYSPLCLNKTVSCSLFPTSRGDFEKFFSKCGVEATFQRRGNGQKKTARRQS